MSASNVKLMEAIFKYIVDVEGAQDLGDLAKQMSLVSKEMDKRNKIVEKRLKLAAQERKVAKQAEKQEKKAQDDAKESGNVIQDVGDAFYNAGRQMGFTGFVLEFTMKRISEGIQGLVKQVVGLTKGIGNADAVLSDMEDTLSKMALADIAFDQDDVDEWMLLWDAAVLLEGQFARLNNMLVPFKRVLIEIAAEGMAKINDEIDKLIRENPQLIKQWEAAARILKDHLVDAIVEFIENAPMWFEKLESMADFVGGVWKGITLEWSNVIKNMEEVYTWLQDIGLAGDGFAETLGRWLVRIMFIGRGLGIVGGIVQLLGVALQGIKWVLGALGVGGGTAAAGAATTGLFAGLNAALTGFLATLLPIVAAIFSLAFLNEITKEFYDLNIFEFIAEKLSWLMDVFVSLTKAPTPTGYDALNEYLNNDSGYEYSSGGDIRGDSRWNRVRENIKEGLTNLIDNMSVSLSEVFSDFMGEFGGGGVFDVGEGINTLTDGMVGFFDTTFPDYAEEIRELLEEFIETEAALADNDISLKEYYERIADAAENNQELLGKINSNIIATNQDISDIVDNTNPEPSFATHVLVGGGDKDKPGWKPLEWKAKGSSASRFAMSDDYDSLRLADMFRDIYGFSYTEKNGTGSYTIGGGTSGQPIGATRAGNINPFGLAPGVLQSWGARESVGGNTYITQYQNIDVENLSAADMQQLEDLWTELARKGYLGNQAYELVTK